MPRGDTNKRGMPPSRNTVWVKPDVPEEILEENWGRAFGTTGPQFDKHSRFEDVRHDVRHLKKVRNDDGSV